MDKMKVAAWIATLSHAEAVALNALVEAIREFNAEFRSGIDEASAKEYDEKRPGLAEAVSELVTIANDNGGELPRGVLPNVASKHNVPSTTLRDAWKRHANSENGGHFE